MRKNAASSKNIEMETRNILGRKEVISQRSSIKN
jgi:hypothetical protein